MKKNFFIHFQLLLERLRLKQKNSTINAKSLNIHLYPKMPDSFS
jgi:hypothetical protein